MNPHALNIGPKLYLENLRLALIFIITLLSAISYADLKEEIKTIDINATKFDSMDYVLNRNVMIYCEINGGKKLVRVKDTANWPKNITTVYNINTDARNNVIRFVEMPSSESGDWNLEITHYFAEDGQVLKFSYRFSTFTSGCAEILSDTREFYYGKDGEIILKKRKITDGNLKPIDTTDCNINDQFEYLKFKTSTEVKAKFGF